MYDWSDSQNSVGTADARYTEFLEVSIWQSCAEYRNSLNPTFREGRPQTELSRSVRVGSSDVVITLVVPTLAQDCEHYYHSPKNESGQERRCGAGRS